MTFAKAARNFIILISIAIGLLLADLYFWAQGQQTWSEAIWGVNQQTLGLAVGVGIVLGHCFTVPRSGGSDVNQSS